MNPSGVAVRRPGLLVVDDDAGVREAYALIFEGVMDVVEAGDAASALEAVRRQAFDVILLDVRMPGVSGVEAFEALRAVQPRVPIVFATAVDTAETAVRAMRLGAFDYLVKPFHQDELMAVVRRALALAGGVVSVVGRDVGTCAALTVLAGARAGVAATVGVEAGAARVVRVDNRPFADMYAEVSAGVRPLDPFVARVAAYVGVHYAHVKIELLAEAVGLSPDHLSRVFRDETTMAAKEFVTRVRIAVARHLLRGTRETLEVIAERVGLCDAPHLARVFRQRTGSTPGAYRGSQAPSAPADDSRQPPRR